MSAIQVMRDHIEVTSFKFVRYTISASAPADIFIDRTSIIALVKEIDKILPRPIKIQYLYHKFEQFKNQIPQFIWTEQSLIDRLCNGLLEPIVTIGGKQLYKIGRDDFLKALETNCFEWQAMYHPADTYDQFQQALYEYQEENSVQLQQFYQSLQNMPDMCSFPINSFTSLTQTSNQTPYSFTVPNPDAWSTLTTIPRSMPESIPASMTLTIPSNFSSQTLTPDATPVEVALGEIRVESGCTTPASPVDEDPQTERQIQHEELSLPRAQSQLPVQVVERGPINRGLDEMIALLCPQEESSRNKRQIPVSQFAIAEKEFKDDQKAAWKIARLVKVLGIDNNSQTSHKWSLRSEKAAIRAMSINDTLNIGSQERKLPEKVRVLFQKYDQNDEDGNESFKRALLMVTIRLLRQKFVNESGKKEPGKYAIDFDAVYKFPTRFMSNAAALCRIVVSCGQPCILIILVRMAIRNKLCLGKLIDQLPLQHFCRFIASGKVTDHHSNADQVTIHDSLSWLHGNILLPLLHTASRRVQKDLFLIEGSLECNENTCLTAIVHHTKQVKYGNYLAGQGGESDWDNGRVLLETRTFDKSSKAEYSIEKNQRTCCRYRLATYSQIEQLEDPPNLLCSQILSMNSN